MSETFSILKKCYLLIFLFIKESEKMWKPLSMFNIKNNSSTAPFSEIRNVSEQQISILVWFMNDAETQISSQKLILFDNLFKIENIYFKL